MGRLNSLVKSIEQKLLVVMMTLMLILGLMQITSRFIIQKPITWSEGILTYMFIWSSYIAASLGIEEKAHFGVDVFVKKLPRKVMKVFAVFANVLVLGFAVFVICQGSYITYFVRNQLMPALPYPMSWPYLALPVFGLFSVVHILYNIKKIITGGN